MANKDTSSPMVSLPSVLSTTTIDAHEKREVAVVNIPNAYVQTPNEGDRVIMKIKGQLALILVKTSPELYSQYLTKEKDKPVLYVQLDRAIYRMLHSGMFSTENLPNFCSNKVYY